ncbi:MAG: TraB/GumN family protein [Chitinophagaceae bacterium]
MKRLIPFIALLLLVQPSQAQPDIKTKKYPSLLWEITGNGLKKPSYLIGTMHVSSKMAFNLPDSFYYALRSVQVVALETNPETWQEDMEKYDLGEDSYADYSSLLGNYVSVPSEYLGINTLKFYKYDKKIERALYSNPSAINNLLYRTYGNDASDFEEDTYLDMYIFQCGKKWGKKVTGVEQYGESMRLMAEAYKDAAKDKNRKERSYGDYDEDYSTDKLQEAYRRGNLDLLDSINKYNSFSPAFDEKFIYRRNEIQAGSIDSVIKSGSTLFVGVGAAHLPGDRGVIELLRKKGYRLRPVKMGERASREKDLVDKIRVPVTFRSDTANDGFFKVDIPGKFYKYGDDAALDQKQCADMSNGSYYLVTRIMTNAWMWNQEPEDVLKVVDSLLYENVPGKIISKTTITRNGYKGYDLTNRTRRGDLQRYNIFVTPYEIIVFKMSGNGDYVKNGPEAERFFGSVQMKEYKNGNGASTPVKKYSPPYGGFAAGFPHDPYIGNDGSWIFDAADKANGNYFRVIRTDIHNYHFAEEDTFDLGLMEESFMASEFIDSQVSRRQFVYKGYPALEGKYLDKSRNLYKTRFIIQGPHYYTLITRSKKENPGTDQFLNSFEIKPYVYGEPKWQRDTALYYAVTTPYFPENKKIKLDIPRYSYSSGDEEDEESEDDLLEAGAYRNKVISNDSTGEKIYVSFYRSSRYHYIKDSSVFEEDTRGSFYNDTTGIYKFRKKYTLPDKTKVWEALVTDSGSSRALWTKVYYKDGLGFALATQLDTLNQPSPFVKQFFEKFTPADTLKGMNPFEKKSALFFADFNSPDTALHKRAVKHIDEIALDSSDLPMLKQAISTLNWNEKKYLETKKSFLAKLSAIKTHASSDYLKQLYYNLDDTIELQYTVLEALLQHKDQYAYNIFRDIITTETPVLDFSGMGRSYSDYVSPGLLARRYLSGGSGYYNDGKFMDNLYDSLKLTRTILPDMLPLLNLDDYKSSMLELLGRMVDSSLVQPKDYETYFSKFLIEARQELKKQTIAEKKKAIEKAEESKTEKKSSYSLYGTDEDNGNDDLSLYAKLLLPFSATNPSVSPFLQQMLKSNDKRLKYDIMLLLLENNKPVPDSLPAYFASLDEYRYDLYKDLKERKKLSLFPAKYNTHEDLGRSALINESYYKKPDTLVFLKRLPAKQKDKKGFVYFFKYKSKKDDIVWKLASAGLTPENPALFEFEDSTDRLTNISVTDYSIYAEGFMRRNDWDFTELSDTKLKEEEPLDAQLARALKKMLYSRHKSARDFYKNEDTRSELIED